MSSQYPGASPININLAYKLPSPITGLRLNLCNSHFLQFSTSLFISSISFSLEILSFIKLLFMQKYIICAFTF